MNQFMVYLKHETNGKEVQFRVEYDTIELATEATEVFCTKNTWTMTKIEPYTKQYGVN